MCVCVCVCVCEGGGAVRGACVCVCVCLSVSVYGVCVCVRVWEEGGGGRGEWEGVNTCDVLSPTSCPVFHFQTNCIYNSFANARDTLLSLLLRVAGTVLTDCHEFMLSASQKE